jgi:hypothetical protein
MVLEQVAAVWCPSLGWGQASGTGVGTVDTIAMSPAVVGVGDIAKEHLAWAWAWAWLG